MQIQCSGDDGGVAILHPAQLTSLTLASKSTGAESVGPLPAQETLQLADVSTNCTYMSSNLSL